MYSIPFSSSSHTWKEEPGPQQREEEQVPVIQHLIFNASSLSLTHSQDYYTRPQGHYTCVFSPTWFDPGRCSESGVVSYTLIQAHTLQVAEPTELWCCLCHHGKPWHPKLPTYWLLRRHSLQCRRHGFDPCVGKISWSRKWWATPVFLSEKFRGQRILGGYSPWGCKQLDMTEWLSITLHSRKALCFERAVDARQQTNCSSLHGLFC